MLKALSAKPVHEDVCSSVTESCFLFIQNEKNLIDVFFNSKNAYCYNWNSTEKYKEESENYVIFNVHY